MAECHKCEHAADVAAGKYRRARFENTPCARCHLTDFVEPGIKFDPARDASTEDVVEPEPERTVPVGVMKTLMVALLSLSRELRDVVCWRYCGMTYREIGEVQGISEAGAERRHQRALREWPELKALFPNKKATTLCPEEEHAGS